jgi:hypothetical protein
MHRFWISSRRSRIHFIFQNMLKRAVTFEFASKNRVDPLLGRQHGDQVSIAIVVKREDDTLTMSMRLRLYWVLDFMGKKDE